VLTSGFISSAWEHKRMLQIVECVHRIGWKYDVTSDAHGMTAKCSPATTIIPVVLEQKFEQASQLIFAVLM
jgi:hypothetical protein